MESQCLLLHAVVFSRVKLLYLHGFGCCWIEGNSFSYRVAFLEHSGSFLQIWPWVSRFCLKALSPQDLVWRETGFLPWHILPTVDVVLHSVLTVSAPTYSSCRPLRFCCLTPSRPLKVLFRPCFSKWMERKFGAHVGTQLRTSSDEFILEASTFFLKIIQGFQVWLWAVCIWGILLGVNSAGCNGFQIGRFNSRGWTVAILPLLNSMLIFSTRTDSSLYIYYSAMHLATHTRFP